MKRTLQNAAAFAAVGYSIFLMASLLSMGYVG